MAGVAARFFFLSVEIHFQRRHVHYIYIIHRQTYTRSALPELEFFADSGCAFWQFPSSVDDSSCSTGYDKRFFFSASYRYYIGKFMCIRIYSLRVICSMTFCFYTFIYTSSFKKMPSFSSISRLKTQRRGMMMPYI